MKIKMKILTINISCEMSLFEQIPDELLAIILYYGHIPSICLIPKYISMVHLVRRQLNMTTGLSLSFLNQYDLNQLIHISKIRTRNRMSASLGHSLVLCNNGHVYSFGCNNCGQLGLSDNVDRNTPTLISKLENVACVSVGDYHSMMSTSDGHVYLSGRNHTNLSTGIVNEPTIIPNLILPHTIISISVGDNHSLLVTSDGLVYSFGNNIHGQLGIGNMIKATRGSQSYASIIQPNNNFRDKPTLIRTLKNVVLTSAGNEYSLALTADGRVYSFGNNYRGQLGLDDYVDRDIPTLIPGLKNVISISTGFSHSLALTEDGYVYSFGNDDHNQLGIVNNSSDIKIPVLIPCLRNIVAISAGYNHSLALTNDGHIYSFGHNLHCQTGFVRRITIKTPTIIPELENIVEISAGYNHSLALTADGHIYTFGNNNQGKLGLGHNRDINCFDMIPNFCTF